jgi:YggT family protein
MPNNLASALAYIINAVSSIVLLILLLRLILPFLRADFRNPVAQGILRITSPIVIPVRRVVPSFGRLDTATILIAFAIQVFTVWVMLKIFGASAAFGDMAFAAVIKLMILTVNLFVYAIIIRIVLSWIARGQYSPVTAIVSTITEPVLRPFRRIIPPLGGFDISPVFAVILLTACTIVISGFLPFSI